MPHIFESCLNCPPTDSHTYRRYNDDPIKALTIHFIFQLDHMTICDNRLNQFRQLAQRTHTTWNFLLGQKYILGPDSGPTVRHVPNRFDRSQSNLKWGSGYATDSSSNAIQFNSTQFDSISFY